MTEYRYTDADGDTLEIDDIYLDGRDETVAEIQTPVNRTVYVPKDEAPAAALALLQAAGWEADALGGPVEHAVRGLAKHIENVAAEKEAAETAAKEAAEAEAKAKAEQDAIEAEALKLVNSFRGAFGYGAAASLDDIPGSKAGWIAAARKAREITPIVSEEVEDDEPAHPRYELKENLVGQWYILDHELGRRASFGVGAGYAARRAFEDLQAGKTTWLYWSLFRPEDRRKPEPRFSVRSFRGGPVWSVFDAETGLDAQFSYKESAERTAKDLNAGTSSVSTWSWTRA